MLIRGPTGAVLTGTQHLPVRHAASPRLGIAPCAALIAILSGGLWGILYWAAGALFR